MSYRHVTEKDVVAGIAGADLRLSQFRAKIKDANGNYVRAGAGDDIDSILENNPNIGEAATVFIGGIHEAVSGIAFPQGARLVSDAQARLVPATGAAGAEVRSYYRAVQEATSPDQIVAVTREVVDVRF